MVGKYIGSSRLRHLNKPPVQKKGNLTWLLCQQAFQLISSQLYWIPNNGLRIRLWEDKIGHLSPLEESQEIANLQAILEQAGKVRLLDIFLWEEIPEQEWKGWESINIPNPLENQYNHLKGILQQYAPINKKVHDTWGWRKTRKY
jgi:hypothetical protein